MEIEGGDIIISGGNTSAFFVEENELTILVMLGIGNKYTAERIVSDFKNGGETQEATEIETETEGKESGSIFNLGGKANDSKIKSDIAQLRAALEIYYADNGVYPETLEELVDANIMKDIPTNPKTDKPYDYDKDGDNYTVFTTLNDGSLYEVDNK